jgi:hypothetical protein
MDTKLKLLDSIDNIKEKLTSQEYKEILENLAKIKVIDDTILLWNGNSVEEINARNITRLTESYKLIKISNKFSSFIGLPLGIYSTITDLLNLVQRYIIDHNLLILEKNRHFVDFDRPGGKELGDLLHLNTKISFSDIYLYVIHQHEYSLLMEDTF